MKDNLLFNASTGTAQDSHDLLDFQHLRAMLDKFLPPIYYVIKEYVPEFDADGNPVFFHLPEGKYTPETMICHPHHSERLLDILIKTGRPVRHLREFAPKPIPLPDMMLR